MTAFAVFFAIGVVAPGEGERPDKEPRSSNESKGPRLSAAAMKTAAECPAGSEPSGVTLRVRGSGINIRTGPGTNHDRVVNEKATRIIGSPQFATIDSSTRIIEDCRQGQWSRIRVVEPEWLRDSHRGWVANRFLLSDKEFDATGFTEEDFLFDDRTRPHKEVIIRGVNKIASEDPRCKDSIDPSSAYISGSRGTPNKPVFFVTCGSGADAVNVFFSEDDLTQDKTFKAPVHIDKAAAIRICEDYAKSAATFPSTVKFSTFWNLGVTEHPNGRTTVVSAFKAKNAFGLELQYDIRCLLHARGLIEASVSERR